MSLLTLRAVLYKNEASGELTLQHRIASKNIQTDMSVVHLYAGATGAFKTAAETQKRSRIPSTHLCIAGWCVWKESTSVSTPTS